MLISGKIDHSLWPIDGQKIGSAFVGSINGRHDGSRYERLISLSNFKFMKKTYTSFSRSLNEPQGKWSTAVAREVLFELRDR
jgi:hypothetical protein